MQTTDIQTTVRDTALMQLEAVVTHMQDAYQAGDTYTRARIMGTALGVIEAITLKLSTSDIHTVTDVLTNHSRKW